MVEGAGQSYSRPDAAVLEWFLCEVAGHVQCTVSAGAPAGDLEGATRDSDRVSETEASKFPNLTQMCLHARWRGHCCLPKKTQNRQSVSASFGLLTDTEVSNLTRYGHADNTAIREIMVALIGGEILRMRKAQQLADTGPVHDLLLSFGNNRLGCDRRLASWVTWRAGRNRTAGQAPCSWSPTSC